MDTNTRKVTMAQAQEEALVFGVDDDGETAEGERLEIVAEPASEPDAWTTDELLSECRCIAALLPGDKAEVHASVGTKNGLLVSIYPNGLCSGSAHHVFGAIGFSDAFAQARAWCATYKDLRREEAERQLAEAQATLAALDAEG